MAKELTAEQRAILDGSFPVSESTSRLQVPRFGMLSKDLTEGKGKALKVVQEAGTFYTERDLGEVDPETGKKVWTKTYLGLNVDVVIAFYRRQLRLFDNGLNKFISSPIFDTADQVVPLYLDKRRIALGTQAELQALYPMTTEKGKKSSKLKEETILYVVYENELYQCNLSQSSKWSFSDYKKRLNPSTVVTQLSSVEETNGSNTFRKITFTSKGPIDGDMFDVVKSSQDTIKSQVDSDAEYFLSQAQTVQIGSSLDEQQRNLAEGK